jgi:Fe-S cluster biogenesis protein NfuA
MMEEQVREVVKNEIQPVLASHGGGVEVIEVKDGVVKVRLKGACAGCIGAQMTIKSIVEAKLKERIPEVVRVEATF